MLVLEKCAIRRETFWQNLHFIPLAIHSFSILLEIAAVNDFEMGLGISIVLNCRSDERRRGVDAIDLSHGKREIGRELAIAAAHIEDTITGLRVEVLKNLLGEFRHERCCR